MPKFHKALYILLFAILGTVMHVPAQAQGSLENMRFTRMMVPIDAVTLKTEGAEIKLWGIQPVRASESHLELRALNLMTSLINNNEVTCKVMNADDVTRPQARCSTQANEDIALRLLQNGLAIRDRRALYDSVFATSYAEAEQMAERNGKGIWALVRADDNSFIEGIINDKEKLFMAIFILVGLPLLAVLILGFIVHSGIRKLLSFQTQQANSRFENEQRLHIREKNLILSRIETELDENKSRVEAFLTVYMEMLSNIKDKNATPQYQQSGDVVSLEPSFVKDAYTENLDKLSALDVKLAAELGKFYNNMNTEAEYLDLPSSTPREEAISIVDKIVSNAREFLPALDRAINLIHSHMNQGR